MSHISGKVSSRRVRRHFKHVSMTVLREVIQGTDSLNLSCLQEIDVVPSGSIPGPLLFSAVVASRPG